MNLEKIYFKLPVAVQNLAMSAYGLKWNNYRFGGEWKNEVEKARLREFWTAEQWHEYQTAELRNLLLYAFDNVPFYTEKYRKAGIERGFLENITIEELKQLPYLTKDEFRQFGDSTLLTVKPRSRGEWSHSSGSTGIPVKLWLPESTTRKFNALMETRVRNWAGVTYKDPRAMVGGRRIMDGNNLRPPFYRYNYVEKQTYISAFFVSDVSVPNIIEGLKKNKVSWITGYASSVFFIADIAKRLGIQAPKLKAAITSSDKLSPEMREVIEEVFGCKTYDSYSGSEACGLISECPERKLLVSPDCGIMEFLDENGNDIAPGETGEIVSTGFLNYEQPLIRYRIGDMAKLSSEQHLVGGRCMPCVDSISGRVEDIIVGPDGRKLNLLSTLFNGMDHIVAAQIVQHTLSSFEIKIIPENGFDKHASEKVLRENLCIRLGNIDVKFTYVDKLPVAPNGKVKAVISHIKENIK